MEYKPGHMVDQFPEYALRDAGSPHEVLRGLVRAADEKMEEGFVTWTDHKLEWRMFKALAAIVADLLPPETD